MNVAIVADPIFKFGGAEKVLEALVDLFPDAHLYTLFIVPDYLERIKKQYPLLKVVSSPFQKLVRGNKITRSISVIKIVSWIYWELIDLSGFDLVISSSHSYMAKNVKAPTQALHISYIHTPPRYLYDEYNEIRLIRIFPFNVLFFPLKKILGLIDRIGAHRPDVIVVNSKTVQERVGKYYGREARIIYPNVETANISRRRKGRNYVFLSRLVKQKGAELAIKTCSHYRLPLIVIGDGDEYGRLKKMAGPTVEFVKGVSEKEKYQILSRAKALIYTSIEEDFGIVPIEALKMGVPVIAYNSGGVRETITDGVNGVTFEERTVESLYEAITRFKRLKIDSNKCIETSAKFSREKFQSEMMRVIKENLLKSINSQ